MKLKPGAVYEVRFLRDVNGYYNHKYPKGSTSKLTNWHCNGTKKCRADWHDKIVECYGHGDFMVFIPNQDIEIIGVINETK